MTTGVGADGRGPRQTRRPRRRHAAVAARRCGSQCGGPPAKPLGCPLLQQARRSPCACTYPYPRAIDSVSSNPRPRRTPRDSLPRSRSRLTRAGDEQPSVDRLSRAGDLCWHSTAPSTVGLARHPRLRPRRRCADLRGSLSVADRRYECPIWVALDRHVGGKRVSGVEVQPVNWRWATAAGPLGYG
jgi:hypothetical protein